MNNGRVLGRGRVLGAKSKPLPTNLPTTSSDSSPSLTNSPSGSVQRSDTPTTFASPVASSDLASNISLLPNNAATANASARLICPICNEQMVTLLQLNRHIDDTHAELDEPAQVEVKNWFQRKVDEAKKFTPLAVLNQKFKALDVFESNGSMSAASSSGAVTGAATTPNSARSAVSATPEPSPRPPITPQRDPEEDVTRAHWQKPTYYENCADPLCGKRLGGGHGSVNCRNCGRLFCDDHTLYQMKLAKNAKHDPIRGVWCRVCETCYKSREGYYDNNGARRDLTSNFVKTRNKTVEALHLETSRLEKRLTKLTQLLANPPLETENRLWNLGSRNSQLRSLEQAIIGWEDDATIKSCPFCHQEFSNFSFRKSHCRLCGRVVCGDLQTKCSLLIGLSVVAEKSQLPLNIDVRMCRDCRHTLFSQSDFDRETKTRPSDQRSYENLVQFERGIRLLLPKFQKLLQLLQDPDNPPTHAQIQEATKVRKRLTDSFLQYESTARRIRDLVSSSPTQIRLQKAVYQQASNFLTLNMLPLKHLPKVLKHASPHGVPNGKPNRSLSAIKYNDRLDVSSQQSSSSAIESLEAEEKELREKLIILEEQKFMVSEMLSEARKKRRFEEMTALSANVDDLTKEIDSLRAKLSRVEGQFEDLYQDIG